VVRCGLRAYAALGVRPRLSGVLFDRPGGRIAPKRFGEYDQAVLNIVVEEEGLTDLPVITRIDFGHTAPMCVLPYGVLAEIDCGAQRFSILESAAIE
jgi:muramoyltetrapeptide carboxypeptidase LdcA involved in peptidoglycan recycling